ncbi:MAG: VWA domain-containing protein [Burkholderiales bacterium]|nr:VWA domain-containing protein [Burkholderiales bacterium]
MDAPYDRLAPLPRALWLPALVTSAGRTAQRLADVHRWREALAGGELPPADAHFGAADAVAPLREATGDLGLPALCQAAPALAEQLLRTLLWHLDRLIDLQPRLTRAEAIAQMADDFRAEWQQQKGDWDDVLALLQGLGDLAHLRWDELRGHLQSREWQEAQRISERLKSLPELAALIRRLGRAERAAAAQALPPQPLEAPLQRLLGVKLVETRLPDAPGELRGIRLSDRIEHMLGSEAAMLLHPVLHKLWRARRAEARLLTYDSEAVLHDLRPDPAAPPRQAVAPPRPEALVRGPIILCLDTSGSMRGAPENIAKAVVLQALRTAHAERRGCLLIAFGGPDELLETELGLSREGLASLLAVMGQSFDGGTDVQAPIERAIERVHEARWTSADLLIVSDGEFGCTPATLDRLDEARERLGLRVQGVLVGDRETLGLLNVADDIFWVRDWRRHGEGAPREAFSPVHSKSLTELYFPNAIPERTRQRRHRP